ncbi:MAG TPA: dihydrofolate reductase family protein [Pseudolysinimonas sp.]|nr:dihydrofolate reductase family protein [Pseudolysinimonas sp.]
MRTVRLSINVSLDGCVDHRSASPNEASHRHAAAAIADADALILGRVTYQLMEAGWRDPSPELPGWTRPFAEAISAQPKYVASRTLTTLDWNSEVIAGDAVEFVRALKRQEGGALFIGGHDFAGQLAAAGLIDEYEFVVHPQVPGYGPRLFDGLPAPLLLTQVGELDLGDGIVARRYVPRARRPAVRTRATRRR